MATASEAESWIASLPEKQRGIVRRVATLATARINAENDSLGVRSQNSARRRYANLGGDSAYEAAFAELRADRALFADWQRHGVTSGFLGQGLTELAMIAAVAGASFALGAGGSASGAAAPGGFSFELPSVGWPTLGEAQTAMEVAGAVGGLGAGAGAKGGIDEGAYLGYSDIGTRATGAEKKSAAPVALGAAGLILGLLALV